MPLHRAVLCLFLVLCWGESLAQPSSSRPARGVPGARPALAETKELYQVLDSVTQTDARSVVAWICDHSLSVTQEGRFQLLVPPQQPLAPSTAACTTPPFQDQTSLAFCSGVLITPQIVATSATCLERAKTFCNGTFVGPDTRVRAVFGFAMQSGGTPPPSFPPSDVFIPQRIIKKTTGRGQNWALIELNRSVGDRAVPLRVEKSRTGSSVQVIGHPQGLPTKVTLTPVLGNGSPLTFTVAPGMVGQSPGSPVFSTGRSAVEGITVSDPVTWKCSPKDSCCQFSLQPGQGTSTTIIRGSTLAQALCAKGQTLCGTGCVDTTSNPAHCGRCDKACALPHALSTCSAGGCRVAACEPGWSDCDKVASNGCEVQLGTQSNCAACGQTCDLANADEACMGGSCQVVSCTTGYANCDSNPANGCEVRLGTTSNCLACGMQCAELPNTIPSCGAGGCEWTCKTGWSNCNDSAGCETSGACAPACSPAACDDQNACTVDACNAAGACTHTAVSCDDGNSCTQDTCNPSSGCVRTPQPGAACSSDGNACTQDLCGSDGTCHHQYMCDDGKACTNDTCDPAIGCRNTAKTCQDDGNACTAELCNASTGLCDKTNVAAGTPCPSIAGCYRGTCNGNGYCSQNWLCTGDETCSGGNCTCVYPDERCGPNQICTDTNSDRFNCGGCGYQCSSDRYCDNGNCRCRTTPTPTLTTGPYTPNYACAE